MRGPNASVGLKVLVGAEYPLPKKAPFGLWLGVICIPEKAQVSYSASISTTECYSHL